MDLNELLSQMSDGERYGWSAAVAAGSNPATRDAIRDGEAMLNTEWPTAKFSEQAAQELADHLLQLPESAKEWFEKYKQLQWSAEINHGRWLLDQALRLSGSFPLPDQFADVVGKLKDDEWLASLPYHEWLSERLRRIGGLGYDREHFRSIGHAALVGDAGGGRASLTILGTEMYSVTIYVENVKELGLGTIVRATRMSITRPYRVTLLMERPL